jgi:hypothetical protein
MTDSEIRRLEMFLRVRSFGTNHASAFPANSRGVEVLAILNTAITEIEGHAAAHESGKRASREGTTLKAVALDALREEMEAINRTARAMAITMPGLDDKFRLPLNQGTQAWIASARAFAQDVVPFKAEFIRRGLPSSFVEDLNANIAAFEDALNHRAQKAGERVAARAALDEAIERGLNAVRELDAIVKNIFRDDPATLAAWTSASHTERSPQRADDKNNPVQPAPVNS